MAVAVRTPPEQAQQAPRRSDRPLIAAIAVLAFAVRLTPVLLGGGLGSFGRYDDGVYYAAADALTFGRVPYRDFVLLHPPGIALVLAPFAFFGRLTSDPAGMAFARLAFMAVGALNAALVTVLARRWSRSAAIAAGLLYACWMPAVYSEQSTMLEPLGSTALLVALVLLLKTPRPPAARAQLAAGAALGLACVLKAWYVAPFATIAAWQLATAPPRAALRVAAAGCAAAGALLLPFAILARGPMFQMIIEDQLRRTPMLEPWNERMVSILGVKIFFTGHPALVTAATMAALVLLAAAVLICLRDRGARILVAVLAVNLLVLLASPSYFHHYAALTAAPLALVFGVAVCRIGARLQPRPAVGQVALLLVAAVILTGGVRTAISKDGRHFPGVQLARAAPAGCVAADDPQALIQINRLSSDLRAGCPLQPDVRGTSYASLFRTGPAGHGLPRADNRAFQRYLASYLLSARSFIVLNARSDGLRPRTARVLARRPVLRDARGFILRAGSASR